MLLTEIRKDRKLLLSLYEYLDRAPFQSIEDLMLYLTERSEIRIALVIDDDSIDLNQMLNAYSSKPDLVILRRYAYKNDILYMYDPLRQEVEDSGSMRAVDEREFDTIVCPAFEEGFKHAYVNNNAWWEIRISQKAREQLKYLAIYEKSPVAAVRNFAEIDKIEPYKNTGKFIVYLKNKRKIKPIPLDKISKGIAPQASRYTTLEKLKKAKKLSDLWK